MIVPLSVQKTNLLYYTLIVVVLGCPLWWYTTDTYRAALPHAAIRRLQEDKLIFNIPLAVCFDAAELPQGRVEQFLISLKPFFLLRSPQVGRVFYDVIPHITSKCNGQHPYTVMFTNNVKRRLRPDLTAEGVLKVSPDKPISGIGDDIVDYIDLKHLHQHVYSIDHSDLHSRNQDVRNAMAVATSYNILLSVVNPDPAQIKIQPDLVHGTETFLEPFLKELKDLAAFTYQTQVLRYVTLPARPHKTADQFYIPESNLPHLINPIESKLGASTSNDINLIIYLVEEQYSPLYIKSSEGSITAVPSFLSPQFGAVLLYDQRNMTAIDHSATFSILLPQLKQLLGLRSSSSAFISSREKFMLEARATLTHILRSIDTLNSLIRLTDSIPNMVISDHIAEQVAAAVDGINRARAALEAHDLKGALRHASLARDAAETSFSDPSILALLYFPDDQKFAIYIPLFLPVGLPLLVAYLELVKERRRGKAKTE